MYILPVILDQDANGQNWSHKNKDYGTPNGSHEQKWYGTPNYTSL